MMGSGALLGHVILMIALVGNFSRDHLPGRVPQVGGGVYHGARALQHLRVPARIVARCAEADREELVPPLARLGTPVRYVPGTATASFSFTYDGDRRTMTVEALGDTWAPGDLPTLPPFRWVHVAPLARDEFPAATLAALARGRRVSFDGQGLVRASKLGPLRLDADFDPEVLRHIWVLKLAEEEAEVLGDPTSLGVRELVITHGSRGSTVYVGGRSEFVPAHRVATDPTGSGDAFSTGYVVARNAGFSPIGAAQRATAVVAAMLSR
jgi:sugar/nucleoside kinase (ribokinase family)